MTSEKICFKCKINPVDNLKLISYCTPCNREKGKENYRANKERYFKSAKKRDAQLDELINKYKSKPCADCKISYPPYIMDLDHLDPSIKEFKISTMRRRRMAFDKIIAEIEKCEVVCANCHRERTNKQNPARYTKISEFAGSNLPTY